MKLRLGYVTNSSSTNHIICWNGSDEDLKALLQKHREKFDLTFEAWDDEVYKTDPDEVIETILGFLKEKKQTKAQYVAEAERQVQYYEEWLEREKKEKRAGTLGFDSIRYIEQSLRTERERLTMDKENVVIIGFGDHEGDVEGGDMGHCMDYEGRDIYIKEKDLYYTTEQNR